MLKKGDIILPIDKVAKKRWIKGLYHPAIVWQDEYEGYGDFLGLMLTHSKPSIKFKNVALKRTHFCDGFLMRYDNSHFVNQLFFKFGNWGEFEKVGKLTDEGIVFIEDNLTNMTPVTYREYRDLQRK